MKQVWEKWKGLERFKYVFLLLLVGLLLLLWPAKKETVPTEAVPDPFQVAQLEEKLASALSRIEGAGQVRVVLTLRESPRRVLAQNGRASQVGEQVSRETSAVLVNRGGGSQEGLELARTGPVWQGALVVADGGDDPLVRLALSEAVSALTGLGADKISICKGK